MKAGDTVWVNHNGVPAKRVIASIRNNWYRLEGEDRAFRLRALYRTEHDATEDEIKHRQRMVRYWARKLFAYASVPGTIDLIRKTLDETA